MECVDICIEKAVANSTLGNCLLNDIISVKQFLESKVNYIQTQI